MPAAPACLSTTDQWLAVLHQDAEEIKALLRQVVDVVELREHARPAPPVGRTGKGR